MVCAVACCGVFLGYWPDACTFCVSCEIHCADADTSEKKRTGTTVHSWCSRLTLKIFSGTDLDVRVDQAPWNSRPT